MDGEKIGESALSKVIPKERNTVSDFEVRGLVGLETIHEHSKGSGR